MVSGADQSDGLSVLDSNDTIKSFSLPFDVQIKLLSIARSRLNY